MIVCLCVDDRFGMMFNGRRQSQDRILRERILADAKAAKARLWMSPYSYKQFDSATANEILQISVEDEFLEQTGSGEFCFVEDRCLTPYEDRIEKVILYRWNRTYPADFYFDLAGKLERWKLISIETFVGTSHDEITREVYEI